MIPVILSAAIIRLRTVADRDTVTARTLLGSPDRAWDDIDGLRFGRTSWARAQLNDGSEVVLPAVTFATLPLLTAASGGRVPNPYELSSLYASGLAPLSNTHTAMPPPMPSSSATNDPMNGRRAQPRPASNP